MHADSNPDAASHINSKYPSVWTSFVALAAFECGWIVVLAILQLLNTGFGITVWPNNEDTNYYMMLEAGGTRGIPSLFWIFDSRNPLNPWFWVPLLSIVNHTQGYELFIVSRVVDFALGCSVFMLLDAVTRSKCRAFSLACGIAVLIWPFARTDHVVWVFNLALAMSIVSLYCYCQFVMGNRQNSRWLATGLLLYFLTIATYTLHLWGILAIPFLSLLLQQHGQPNRAPWYSRFGSGCIDLIWYFGFLAAYFLIWDTASPFSAPARGWMTLASVSKQLPMSVASLVISSADIGHLLAISHLWNKGFLLGISIFFASCYAFFFHKIFRRNPEGASLGFDTRPSMAELATLIAVLAALSAGIVQIESTTTIWSPGTRTPMVQKIVQPCLIVFASFMLIGLIPTKQALFRHYLVIGCLASICTLGSLLALCNNSDKWRVTEKHIHALKAVIDSPLIKECTSKNLVIILDKSTGNFLPAFQFRKYLAPKLVPHADSVTLVQVRSGPSRLINHTSVILEENNKGIALRLPKQINGYTMVPYDQVAFFRYTSEEGLQKISELQEKDWQGTDANVLRKEWPVRLKTSN